MLYKGRREEGEEEQEERREGREERGREEGRRRGRKRPSDCHFVMTKLNKNNKWKMSE